MIVVCNATPLIYLAAIGRFDLPQQLYGRIQIPMAVYDEVVVQGSGRWGAAETANADWIDRHTVTNISDVASLQSFLHGGESEVVVLAEEIHADLAIVDDLAARRELARRGVAFLGTLGILIRAKSEGHLSILKPEFDKLRSSGFRLSNRVYQSCLNAVAE
jgi:uncharacterized protein